MVIFSALLAILLFLFSDFVFAKSFGTRLCKTNPDYHCYTVKRGDTWEKLFQDPEQKIMMMKINRINLKLHSGMVIAIPNNQNVSVLDVSPIDKEIEAPGGKVIIVSLDKLAWGAYDENGTLINWGPVSGGKGYCPDIGRGCHTKTGKFAVYQKQGKWCVSTKFPVGRGGAPMPYCMFFYGGFALHGSPEVPGYNASHGCVRLFVNDAKWLNEEFVGSDHVAVIVR